MGFRKPLFIANWKMNKLSKEVQSFVAPFVQATKELGSDCEMVLAPTAVYLAQLVSATQGTSIQVAAQNGGTTKSGAFTGEAGIRYTTRRFKPPGFTTRMKTTKTRT